MASFDFLWNMERAQKKCSESSESPDLPEQAPPLTPNEEKLNTFILFPKLPIELRLKIWRFNFPRGRCIALDTHLFRFGSIPKAPHQTAVQFEEVRSWGNDSPTEFPVALWVNKESRQETSRHYIIVLPKKRTWDGQRPVCYNPSLDDAFTDLFSPKPEIAWNTMTQVDSEVPQVFTATKVLRIFRWLNYSLTQGTFDQDFVVEKNLAGRLEIRSDSFKNPHDSRTSKLLKFTALEQVNLMVPKWADKYRQEGLKLVETFKEQMIEFLLENSEAWLGVERCQQSQLRNTRTVSKTTGV
jgi:hypothetical protein